MGDGDHDQDHDQQPGAVAGSTSDMTVRDAGQEEQHAGVPLPSCPRC
jgi:hypothetical protein